MTEDEARDWLVANCGTAGFTVLERYVDLLTAESTRQNLIAPSTLDTIWSRHIVDSAQLLLFAERQTGIWLDIGSGAGLPGMVIAILRDQPAMLVEPRKRRVEFLTECISSLNLSNVEVRCCRIEAIKQQVSVISARAVGAIEQLFRAASDCASEDTLWILPRGKSGAEELAQAKKSWQGTFHVEHSLTHSDSKVVVARGVIQR